MIIRPFKQADLEQLITLILPIQQIEFNVPITIDDQPDLLNIESFYRKGNGNFWCAVSGEKIVGSIALIDIGNRQGVIRKMFVHPDFRGKEKKTAQLLLDELTQWCGHRQLHELFLGTIDTMLAAQKFYIRNGFATIEKSALPDSFPVMKVDNLFFKKQLLSNEQAQRNLKIIFL
ncbi:MAG: GNAT family N-acetyltransferase [Chitinophagales bacterium]